jgi:hypothetical protein
MTMHWYVKVPVYLNFSVYFHFDDGLVKIKYLGIQIDQQITLPLRRGGSPKFHVTSWCHDSSTTSVCSEYTYLSVSVEGGITI